MSKKQKILLIEDEPNLAFSLKLNLEAEGYAVQVASSGTKGIRLFDDADDVDLVIADAMLPGMDGYRMVKLIRERAPAIGILMLTARAQEEDRIQGFNVGVDDYITKPFHLEELLLRVKRMMARAAMMATENTDNLPGKSTQNAVIRRGPFALLFSELEFHAPTGIHHLTTMEAEVLAAFLKNPNRILTREFLLEEVWGVRSTMETRTVDNFIVRLRRFLEIDPTKPEYLVSVRGRGYRLMVD